MRFKQIEVKDKLGRRVMIHNAEVEDAMDLMKYMKETSLETKFLIREPDEFQLTLSQEEKYIKSMIDHPKELMLVATIDGMLIGSCSLTCIGSYRRYAHRCNVAIALYKKYCKAGIGDIMLNILLSIAKEIGYEQVELEVVCDNIGAIALYEKLGFEKCGTFPNYMKYADSTYIDAYLMVKKL